MTKSALVNQHYQTNIDGLFVCGNALHVHDLVDWVTKESELVGWILQQIQSFYDLSQLNASLPYMRLMQMTFIRSIPMMQKAHIWQRNI